MDELTLEPGPAAAPRARHFATEALAAAGANPDVINTAALVVTELVANAVLHGEPPVTVRLHPLPGGARVEVHDCGGNLPIRVANVGGSMTGRGLHLVAAVATAWGAEPDGGTGKVVWAQLGADPATPPLPPDPAGLPECPPPAEEEQEQQFEIDLGEVPTDLVVAAKAHVDNVARELALATGPLAAQPPPVVRRVEHLIHDDFSAARAQIKEQAMRAAAERRPLTHLRLTLPAAAADAAERYLAALDEADRFARNARLLTLETPPAHRLFRHWYAQCVAESLRRQAAGEPPPRLPSFTQRLAAEYAALAPVRERAGRLELVQRVTADLAAAVTAADMVQAVARDAHELLGASTAVVYLLGDDGMLREAARAGDGDRVLAHSYEEYPLDAHLPGSLALRTGETLLFRSRADLLERFPKLAGAYAEDTTLLVAPLIVGAHRLGVLALRFAGPTVTDEGDYRTLVTTLAGVMAQALERAQAASAASASAETLAFLARASVVLASSLDYRTVLQATADLVVPHLADWCVVQLMENDRLVTVGLTHFDAERTAWARSLQDRYPTDMSAASGALHVIRTGRSELYEHLPAELIEAGAVDEEHRQMLRTLGMTSALVVPMAGRGGIIGAITMIHAESGRRYTAADVAVAEDLARRAALAVEAAHAFREQSDRLAALARVAAVAQRAILAPPPAQVGPVALRARYVSAAAEALVGGDLYETVRRPGAVRLLIGDVRGKGLEAVRIATIVLGEFRAAAADIDDLAEVARQLDRRLVGYLGEEDFVTAVIAEITDGGGYTVVNCGHPPPLLISGGVAREVLGPPTLPLGLQADPAAISGQLRPGDRLLMFTDGVVEARDATGAFVDLASVTAPAVTGGIDDSLDGILLALRTATRGALGDDLALLLAEYRGLPVPAPTPPAPAPRSAEPATS